MPMAFGPYLLLKPLGRGSMGDVHLAKPIDPRLRLPSPLVIKRLHPEHTSVGTFVRRFEHEARIAVRVDSKNVAKVYDVGRVGETLYMALEYIPGWPLSRMVEELVAAKKNASLGAIADIIHDVLNGAHALHTATGE